MWPSRFAAVLLLLPAALIAPALPTGAAGDPPCKPGLGIGLVEFPAGSKDPRAHAYIVDHVNPGTRFSRRFQVCNGSERPITVSLYASAAELSGGVFQVLEGRSANELTSWISVAPSTLTLQPGQRGLARASIAVPAAAESGERYAVVQAELPGRPTSNGLPVTSRVGIRVYLDVGPGGAPKSDFVVDTLQAERTADGRAQVTARVHNTGGRALDFSGSLSLRDGPGGLTGGPYPAKLGTTLAPGETEPVVVPIDTAIADGPWTARLTLRSGLIERRVEANLVFPDTTGAAAPVDVEQLPVPSDEVVHPERTLLAIGLPLLALAALVGWRRRTRRTAQ